MSKPFDASLNTLIDECEADWAAYLAIQVGLQPGPFQPVETDISRTIQADRAFRIQGPPDEVVHLEMESSSYLGIPKNLLRYNAILHRVTHLPVHSILILLRRSPRASDQTGIYEVRSANGKRIHTFEYTVIPVWEQSLESYLSVPGLMPLALLTDEAAEDLNEAFGRFRDALRKPDISPSVVPTLLTTSYTLCGLRHDETLIRRLYMSLSRVMEDSTTYQWIVNQGFAKGEAEGRVKGEAEGRVKGEAEGRLRAAREFVLKLGTRRFGMPGSAERLAIEQIGDVARLERMGEQLVADAISWDDLLRTP